MGCAGSFDDAPGRSAGGGPGAEPRRRALRHPRAAGVCSGDPARRAGNEYLFQILAEQNVETLNARRCQKVVANCPHCFNTLRNEYPQYGGNYEVVHHTQLFAS